MEFFDHIASSLALVFGGIAVWVARKTGRLAQRQTIEAVVRDACDYSDAHPQEGIPREQTAFVTAVRLDLKADGRRDFTDAALMLGVRAELARRAKLVAKAV